MPQERYLTLPPFVKNILATLIVALVTTISAFVWDKHSEYATRGDVQSAVVEIRLHQVEESLRRYHDLGVQTLDDSDKHRYNTLVQAEATLNEQRKKLLGLSN